MGKYFIKRIFTALIVVLVVDSVTGTLMTADTAVLAVRAERSLGAGIDMEPISQWGPGLDLEIGRAHV